MGPLHLTCVIADRLDVMVLGGKEARPLQGTARYPPALGKGPLMEAWEALRTALTMSLINTSELLIPIIVSGSLLLLSLKARPSLGGEVFPGVTSTISMRCWTILACWDAFTISSIGRERNFSFSLLHRESGWNPNSISDAR